MIKIVRTPEYNTTFDTRTGHFERWGLSFVDDPTYSPIGPELADIEISTICNNNCPHCYKSNNDVGQNMSIETFRKVLKNLPKSITQIAFGIGSINSNPDMFKIFEECRLHDIVPNVTISSDDFITFDHAKEIYNLCGAIAISNYNKNRCYEKINYFTHELKMKQVNIHQLLSEETFDQCLEVAKDSITDPRLSNLNAIVFLSLKRKGRGKDYNRVTDEHFKELVKYCLDNNVRFGFDSCTANKFLKCIKELGDQELYNKLNILVEPCESGLFSIYVNVEGKVFPCSFVEPMGIFGNLLEVDDFLQDVWYGENMKQWRKRLIKDCRECPLYVV